MVHNVVVFVDVPVKFKMVCKSCGGKLVPNDTGNLKLHADCVQPSEAGPMIHATFEEDPTGHFVILD